jgi:flavorubredoxin
MFPLVCQAIASVIPVQSLRYICFSHYEADECGSLNDFLEAAPGAEPLCSRVAKMVSIDDIALRPAHALADGEELSLGSHTVRWIDTPHLPHGWECGHLFETTDDILTSSEEMRAAMDYFSQTRHVQELMEKLAETSPRILACMHGAAWQGDGAALLRQLGKRLAA